MKLRCPVRGRARQAALARLADIRREQLASFRNKASGWLAVVIGLLRLVWRQRC